MPIAYEIKLRKKYNSAKEGFIVSRYWPTSAKTAKGLEQAKSNAKAFADALIKSANGERYTLELVSIEERR